MSAILCPGGLATPILTSQQAHTAGGQYSDREGTSSAIEAGAGIEADPWRTSRHYASSISMVMRKASATQSSEDTPVSSTTNSGSINVGQNVSLLHNVGFSYETSRTTAEEKKSDAKAYGVRVASWLFPERLRLGIAYRKNEIATDAFDYTDIDGKRVISPDKIKGKTTTIDLLVFPGSTTITEAEWSWTNREDRPPAWTSGFKLRQYVNVVRGALHLQGQHAENIGTIRPVTDYGRVIANSLTTEWHQKFDPQWVVMAGFRTYIEEEAPRATQSARQITGSDYMYLSARYRLIRSWTLRASEISAVWGRYFNNRTQKGQLLALGFNWSKE